MTNKFIFIELLLFALPPVTIIILRKYFRSYLKYFKGFPLNEAMVLIPLWLTIIHLLSLLLFGFTLVHFIVLMTSLAVGVHLYFYILKVDRFSIKKYFYEACKITFIFLTIFLYGLTLLRIYSYFG